MRDATARMGPRRWSLQRSVTVVPSVAPSPTSSPSSGSPSSPSSPLGASLRDLGPRWPWSSSSGHHHYVAASWGLCRRDLWRQTLWTLAHVLANALVSVVWSGLALVTCATGGVWTGRRPQAQSYGEFVAGIMMWNMSLFGLMIIVIHVALLVGKTFVQHKPPHPASFAFCLRRMLRATAGSVVLWVLLIVGFVLALEALTHGRGRWLRLDFYASCLWGWWIMTNVWMHARRIYHQETCEGLVDAQRKADEGRTSLILAASVVPVEQRWQRLRQRLRWLRRALRRGLFLTMSAILAGLYTQLTSRVVLRTQRELLLFALGSLGVKVALQGVFKHYLIRGRAAQDIRTMFLTVGVPTVLIDTQVRVLLQAGGSNVTSVGGALGLAIVEIGLRGSKVALLRRQISRTPPPETLGAPVSPRSPTVILPAPRLALGNPPRQQSHTTLGPVRQQSETKLPRGPSRQALGASGRSPPPLLTRPSKLFRLTFLHDPSLTWLQRMLQFHAAEAYADMSAEYIAILCSALIISVYGRHPKYNLLAVRAAWVGGDNNSDEPHDPSSDLAAVAWVLVFQIGLEMVVDLVSTTFELSRGVDFDGLQRYRLYIAVAFVGMGVLNIQVSALMYVQIT